MNEPLTTEQLDTLRAYAAQNGRTWKTRLLLDWQEGLDENEPVLRAIRNSFGPAWLVKFNLRKAVQQS